LFAHGIDGARMQGKFLAASGSQPIEVKAARPTLIPFQRLLLSLVAEIPDKIAGACLPTEQRSQRLDAVSIDQQHMPTLVRFRDVDKTSNLIEMSISRRSIFQPQERHFLPGSSAGVSVPENKMKGHPYCALAAAGLLLSGGAFAQERVVGAKDPEALFHSSDPKLNANKQVAYLVAKDIPEAVNTQTIDKYLTERYIQHNPNIPSGRDGKKKMMAIMKPRPKSEKLSEQVVSVVAEGDFVVVSSVMERPDPKNPGKTYTTTHFDKWRMKDGKADEHWDDAALGDMGPPPAPPASRGK
jgi:predicted SnoaL-like aldol condensation-catalyzing enzyme